MLLSTETFFNSFISLLFVWFIVNYRSFLLRAVQTIPRDLHGLAFLLSFRLKMLLVRWRQLRTYNLYEATIKKFGAGKVACILDDVWWTFGDLKAYCDRAANVYLSLGLREGDHIALFSETTAFYSQIWLAADKIGLATGLINYGLKNESLIHSLNEVKPKLIITSSTLAHLLEELNLDSSYKVAVFDDSITTQKIDERIKQGLVKSPKMSEILGRHKDWISFDREISKAQPLGPYKCQQFKLSQPMLFIFTSGTTGFPKAAVITIARYYLMSYGPHFLLRMNSSDVLYTTLPLYHSAGGIAGMGQCILFGMCQVLRKKFSASQFWNDCKKYDCTIVQYIGEICRYLLAQQVREGEADHKVRLAFGNGIRPQVWRDFVKRFKVPRIGEFYGATESSANFVNTTNKFGAIGFSSIIFPWAYPVYLVKTDLTNGELIRDPKTGLCQQVNFNEPGQLIGKMQTSSGISFDGYLNKKESSKKVVHDVFKKGDRWFLTGDLLEQDEFGYFYFKDRLGDTFRWRGENVSTNEVESVISHGLKLNDCVVYGVPIPNCEGKAGMAAIALESLKEEICPGQNDDTNFYKSEALKMSKDSGIFVPEEEDKAKITIQEPGKKVCQDSFNRIDKFINNLKSYMEKNLPPYAQPLFIRICRNITLTGTFKMKKVNLVIDGYNPEACSSDILFYLNSANRSYELLSEKVYANIIRGAVRF